MAVKKTLLLFTFLLLAGIANLAISDQQIAIADSSMELQPENSPLWCEGVDGSDSDLQTGYGTSTGQLRLRTIILAPGEPFIPSSHCVSAHQIRAPPVSVM